MEFPPDAIVITITDQAVNMPLEDQYPNIIVGFDATIEPDDMMINRDLNIAEDQFVHQDLLMEDADSYVMCDVEEICDGDTDEDCDGTVDEGCSCIVGEQRTCGSMEGACQTGTQTCMEDGTWSDECVGAIEASNEICDMIDNDCDGEIDEEGVCPCYTFMTQSQKYMVCGSQGDDVLNGVDEISTWGTARDHCLSFAMDLLSIQTEEENLDIANHIREAISTGSFNAELVPFWIGFNDRNQEGQHEWSDGYMGAFRAWDAGEPNNGNDNDAEDCVLMRIRTDDRHGRWDDRECSSRHPYICKMN